MPFPTLEATHELLSRWSARDSDRYALPEQLPGAV